MKLKAKSKIVCTAYVASSIDGRIAKNSTSAPSWTSTEDWNFFQKSLANSDVVIVGHNTFKVSEKRLNKRNTIVFTSKVKNTKTVGSVVFFNPKKNDVLIYLKKKGYRNVSIIGGPRVYYFFLERKLLDNLYVTIEPFVFSNGISMFFGKVFKKYKFILESIDKLNKKGTILLKYKYAN